jgi:hypothetical protein
MTSNRYCGICNRANVLSVVVQEIMTLEATVEKYRAGENGEAHRFMQRVSKREKSWFGFEAGRAQVASLRARIRIETFGAQVKKARRGCATPRL